MPLRFGIRPALVGQALVKLEAREAGQANVEDQARGPSALLR
jgi:hypothetical protein